MVAGAGGAGGEPVDGEMAQLAREAHRDIRGCTRQSPIPAQTRRLAAPFFISGSSSKGWGGRGRGGESAREIHRRRTRGWPRPDDSGAEDAHLGRAPLGAQRNPVWGHLPPPPCVRKHIARSRHCHGHSLPLLGQSLSPLRFCSRAHLCYPAWPDKAALSDVQREGVKEYPGGGRWHGHAVPVLGQAQSPLSLTAAPGSSLQRLVPRCSPLFLTAAPFP